MKRNILSQVLYQALVMATLLYMTPSMFDIQYDIVNDFTSVPANRNVHYTFLFHTLVLMNLFNMFNCRKLGSEGSRDLNIFEHIYRNWWFLAVFFLELNVQYAMVGGYISPIVRCSPLSAGMHITSVCLGLGSIAVGTLTKLTPV